MFNLFNDEGRTTVGKTGGKRHESNGEAFPGGSKNYAYWSVNIAGTPDEIGSLTGWLKDLSVRERRSVGHTVFSILQECMDNLEEGDA